MRAPVASASASVDRPLPMLPPPMVTVSVGEPPKPEAPAVTAAHVVQQRLSEIDKLRGELGSPLRHVPETIQGQGRRQLAGEGADGGSRRHGSDERARVDWRRRECEGDGIAVDVLAVADI